MVQYSVNITNLNRSGHRREFVAGELDNTAVADAGSILNAKAVKACRCSPGQETTTWMRSLFCIAITTMSVRCRCRCGISQAHVLMSDEFFIISACCTFVNVMTRQRDDAGNPRISALHARRGGRHRAALSGVQNTNREWNGVVQQMRAVRFADAGIF